LDRGVNDRVQTFGRSDNAAPEIDHQPTVNVRCVSWSVLVLNAEVTSMTRSQADWKSD
jgi:hypothetical protein